MTNISAISGLYGNTGQVNYSAGKAGIIGMTKAMSKEWGRYKVNVNCVAFGLIETRLSQALGSEDAEIAIGGQSIPVGVRTTNLESIPLGRVGTPVEAAGAVYLLCLPESNYISGQVIVCSGGLRI